MTTDDTTQSKFTLSGSTLSYYSRLLSRIASNPFLAIFGLIGSFMTLGATGYMIIEGWNFTDSLYMTVITMSTIGYGEVRPLTENGRIFTIFIIAFGVVIATYAISATIELATSDELRKQIQDRRRRRTLEKIKDHTIICGFGRLGRSLAKELIVQGSPVIVIDLNPEVAHESEERGFATIEGSGADEKTLNKAQIHSARALVAAAKSDAENVFIVLTARSINPNLQIIARTNRESSIPKLETAGANLVISPYTITGHRIANTIIRPNVIDFLDGVLQFGDHQMRIEEMIIDETSPLANKTLQEAKLKTAVLAVDHPGEMVFTHPNANTKLIPGTAIIVMGLEEELEALIKLVNGN